MSTITARASRIALGLTLGLAALGGGVASAAPTAGDAASPQSSQATTLAGARPAFKAPFNCGTTWRGSAWTTSGGATHDPLKSVDWNSGSGGDSDLGLPVRASAAGEIQYAGPVAGGYGNRVVIKHGSSGWKTKYAHLMDGSITVGVGQQVSQGQRIGSVGKSGGQESSHLHYEQIADGNVVNAVVQGVTFNPNDVHFITSNNAC